MKSLKADRISSHVSRLKRVAAILFLLGLGAGLPHAESGPEDEAPGITPRMLDEMTQLPGGIAALPPVASAAHTDNAEVELGKMLFFDKRLSLDNSISCATCHDPSKGFADGRRLAIGFGGKQLQRHSPTVLNAAYNTPQFWDGRARGLVEQAGKPIIAAGEMNMGSDANVSDRLNAAGYRERFYAVYGAAPSLKYAARAITAFERTLVTPGSRFDQYAAGNKQALTEQEKRGLILFIGRASCSQCHNGVNFTDNLFHALTGPADSPATDDQGRYKVTRAEADKYAFKTPTLRNVALTAPYMHNGAFATLEEVIDFYDQGGANSPYKSKLLFKLDLTSGEKQDLVAFLKTLTGQIPRPSAPPLP